MSKRVAANEYVEFWICSHKSKVRPQVFISHGVAWELVNFLLKCVNNARVVIWSICRKCVWSRGKCSKKLGKWWKNLWDFVLYIYWYVVKWMLQQNLYLLSINFSFSDLIRQMSATSEMDKLQKQRALGPAKHRKLVSEFITNIKLNLAECLFCWACQTPFNREDTLHLINHLQSHIETTADGKFDNVTVTLLMALLYSIDIHILDQEESEGTFQNFVHGNVKNPCFCRNTVFVLLNAQCAEVMIGCAFIY